MCLVIRQLKTTCVCVCVVVCLFVCCGYLWHLFEKCINRDVSFSFPRRIIIIIIIDPMMRMSSH